MVFERKKETGERMSNVKVQMKSKVQIMKLIKKGEIF